MEKDVSLRSFDLLNVDLASAEGCLMLQVISAFNEFERNRIRGRISEGLAKARTSGVA
ncbi:hypothetical protein C0068_10500 [Zhongshania marina]|uniref:Resolvase/invertase-type recombinase catalytic domain-containing protein n=2 Tax=Zhongshania marina TaxID=2304603 RepID=A0A2S4HFH2_9GAMM|nr:hypothetical protein C0068_10500 [Marortus luteolus]